MLHNFMNIKQTQIIILLAGWISIYFASKYNKNETPLHVIYENYKLCEFPKPGSWRKGPYVTGIKYCPASSKRPYIELMSHMLAHVKDNSDLSIAAEYGSPLKVIRYKKQFMFNPVIIDRSERTNLCRDDITGAGDITEGFRSLHIKVEFINGSFQDDTLSFERGDACIIQAVLLFL